MCRRLWDDGAVLLQLPVAGPSDLVVLLAQTEVRCGHHDETDDLHDSYDRLEAVFKTG